jgi:hypothetical protein
MLRKFTAISTATGANIMGKYSHCPCFLERIEKAILLKSCVICGI